METNLKSSKQPILVATAVIATAWQLMGNLVFRAELNLKIRPAAQAPFICRPMRFTHERT